ncbi:MAG: hypothetical protein J7502_02765 [Flavisolibacter sp.]|nr:hypothetical protein [Flavisolibacter sp.]
MKKLVLSFLLIGALAVAGSAQTTKTTKSTQPVTKSKTVTKTDSTSSNVQAHKPMTTTTTAPGKKTAMTKPRHKHHPAHKTKQKTTSK